LLIVAACGGKKKYAIIEQKCGLCHSVNIVYKEKRSNYEWDRIIYAMKQRGLKLSETEENDIKKILYKSF
jgi:hypothetical protein